MATYLVKNVPLTTSEAVNILRNPPSDSQCVSAVPLNVQGGEVYVFKPSSADKESILWLCKIDLYSPTCIITEAT